MCSYKMKNFLGNVRHDEEMYEVGVIKIILKLRPNLVQGNNLDFRKDITPMRSSVLLSAICNNWTKVQNRVVIYFVCGYFCPCVEWHITQLKR
jgi:protoheme ferro-lyase